MRDFAKSMYVGFVFVATLYFQSDCSCLLEDVIFEDKSDDIPRFEDCINDADAIVRSSDDNLLISVGDLTYTIDPKGKVSINGRKVDPKEIQITYQNKSKRLFDRTLNQ